MKRLLFGSLLLWSAGIFAQQPMDLRTYCGDCGCQQPADTSGAANVAANEFAVQQSRLSLLPNLNFSANYFWSFGRGIDYVTNTYVAQNFESNSFTLSSNMGLYTGGSRPTGSKAGYDLETARLDQQSMIETYSSTPYWHFFRSSMQKIR